MIGTFSATTNPTISKSNNETIKISTYTISYFDKAIGGNILKNSKIAKNMPKKALSQKIVKMVKKGSVILKFGNGKSKVLISASIHGNEVAANIVALKLVESLKNKKIKGSVYIIPFKIPKSTAANIRSFSTKGNPNRIANISKTLGYKILQFAKKNNIPNSIDVHNGGGINSYKKGFIYANRKPTNIKETKWIKYIKKYTNSYIRYNTVTKGYLKAYAKTNKISTITLEVERDRGSVSK